MGGENITNTLLACPTRKNTNHETVACCCGSYQPTYCQQTCSPVLTCGTE